MGFNKQPWFNEKKFGIFVHYGLYSQIERGEWTMQYEHIPYDEYKHLADTFDPSRFDADRLARQAKDAGAGYLVLTTRHHEGFCLYDSQYSDFNSVKYVGRDLVREHVEACRRHGLRVGLYYSLLDWRFKGYHNRAKYPESCEAMDSVVHDYEVTFHTTLEFEKTYRLWTRAHEAILVQCEDEIWFLPQTESDWIRSRLTGLA